MQEDNHVFQGLRRDNHQIRQDAKFLWDAHNIRITNREDNTLLSLTNEKGTSDSLVEFQGYYVGHCVLGKYLVVFTANDDASYCTIYRVERLEDGGYKTIILFKDNSGQPWWSEDSKGWAPGHPIEALGCYENELIQKVYWIDGISQPRVINIVQPELLIPEEFHGTLIVDGTNFSNPDDSTDSAAKTKLKELYPSGIWTKNFNSFDFVQTLKLEEKVKVEKLFSGGSFSPGTIQYAFTYYNRFGQESKIFYTTGLHYISLEDRGGSPEDKISNQFKITISNCDDFNYVRIYSIHRTSLDAIPTVKLVSDVRVMNGSIQYTDSGTSGHIVDNSQLLYIGGVSIIPSSMVAKDGTLFFGNILIDSQNKFSTIKELIEKSSLAKSDHVIRSYNNDFNKGQYYSYTPRGIVNEFTGGFKYGETYRCGIQVQTVDGEWSSPIHLGDFKLNEWFPGTQSVIKIQSKKWNLPASLATSLYNKGVRRVRPCVVFPTPLEYDILCQGVLAPTVYNVDCRRTDSPYSQSSWFFRNVPENLANSENIREGAKVEFRHNRPLLYGPNRGAEIQNMQNSTVKTIADVSNPDTYKSYFFVDSNIVTMHSPDIEFNDSIQLINWNDTELVILGSAFVGATVGDIDIQTSTPTFTPTAAGFNKHTVGYGMRDDLIPYGGGLVSGIFYEDYKVFNTFEDGLLTRFMVYPWHRSGSLNNDSARPDNKGTRSAVLSKKKISNLRFSYKSVKEMEFHYGISTPQLFNSNEVALLKVDVPYMNKAVSYYGNVDYMVTSGADYDIYTSGAFAGEITPLSAETSSIVIKTSKDPVRLKYKSTPHLVFSLEDDDPGKISILPRRSSEGDATNLDGETYTIPEWSTVVDPSDPDTSPTDALLLGHITTRYSPMENTYETSRIGQYVYDQTNRLDSHEFGTIWQIQASSTHVTDVMYVNNLNGTIFKIEKGVTWLDEGTGIFSGLPKDSNGIYTGETKYYIATKTGNGLGDGSAHLYTFSEYIPGGGASRAPSRATAGKSFTISQKSFGDSGTLYPSYLLWGEIRRKTPLPASVKFGGNTPEALRENLWFPASEAVDIEPNKAADVKFEWGDTWYSRYDCLKTYPFTQEDENSVVEIASFMCETRVNMDGRYDRNRGQLSNLNMTPQNFNLLNSVYNQKDNFFNYRILDDTYYRNSRYANQITWSLEKTSASDTDPWTNITLANTLDMDGEKGKVTALRTWNEYLLCFQEKALSQILFNSRVQIPTTDGVPIEISNGYKVDGSRLLSGNIGCSNKWATTTTTTGIYFLDSNTDSLYIFNGQLANLSEDRGMDWWVRQNHTSRLWQPILYGNNVLNGIRAFYDNKYGDVYFTPGPTDNAVQPEALCYSEQLGQFTSFMSYGGTQAMFNFADGFYSLRETDGNVKLYENNAGYHNNFYGTPKGWSFSFISNQNPTFTKIFDTIDLRTDHYWTYGTEQLLNSCPMNYMEVDNEYQHSGTVLLDSRNMRKKFRVWRGLLPRNKGTRQRIRNPWSMITLGWNPLETTQPGDNTKKAVVHDVSVKYTV